MENLGHCDVGDANRYHIAGKQVHLSGSNPHMCRILTSNYHSKECQSDHWKSGHKGECQILSQSKEEKEFLVSPTTKHGEPVSKKVSLPSNKINLFSFHSNIRCLPTNITPTQLIKRDEVPLSDYLFPPKRIPQMMNFRDNITAVFLMPVYIFT